MKNEIMSHKDLAEELYKPVTKKFNKRKVQSQFIDNIWGAHLADVQFNKQILSRKLFFIMCY